MACSHLAWDPDAEARGSHYGLWYRGEEVSVLNNVLNFRAAASALLQRYQFARAAGMSFGGRRDTWGVLGYPEINALTTRDYLDRYERGGVAGRVVDVLPDGTWRGEMELIEDENPNTITPFEQAWQDLDHRLAIRQRLHQTDVLARLSSYAVLLLGTADGELDKELPTGSADQLLYLQPYLGAGGPTQGRGTPNYTGADADVTISEYDLDSKSPRFALPLFYQLTRSNIAAELLQRNIHWSRVIHVAEGTLRDDVFGRPALERIWNHLEDLDKVVGGGSEAFWIRANAGIHMNVDKDMVLSTDAQAELKKLAEQAEEYQHQLTRMIRTRGVEVNQLGSDVANFQSPADVIITLIAGSCGIPKRLLVGSERGELASTQDRENFRDLINGRQANFAGPKMVRALTDRLIEYGYLPKPKQYKVSWPTIETMSENEKSQGAAGWASVNSAMGKTVFTDNEIRDRWAGLKPLTEEQLKAIEEEDAKKQEQQKELVEAKKPDIVPAKFGPVKGSVEKGPKAAEAAEVIGDDELVRILADALETGADEVVGAIVGLGGKGSGRYPKGSGRQTASAGFVKGTKAQAKALGLPPAWTDVMINPDPKGDLLATGKDVKGRTQYRYSANHNDKAAAEKHGRVSAFGKSLPGLRKQIGKDYETSDEAVIMDLMDKGSFRKGSDRDTKATVKAYGASTLLDEHVTVKGNDVHFDFIAKKGTRVQKTITDPRMAKELKARKAASKGGKLFPNTSEKKIADYMENGAPGFTPKDFRTWNATREAHALIKSMKAPKTKAEFQTARLEVGTKVGAILGHTEKGGGKIALKSYISPSVFAKWEAKL